MTTAHRLDVGQGHVLHVATFGDPDGSPVLYVHGGPGSGCRDAARDLFDPDRHLAVFVDQRAAGRSTPHASEPGVDWSSIDMDHHVADLERVREHLGIDRWAVYGVSWGSVLGATYAERHPDRVSEVILAAVSTGTRADIDWVTVDVGRLFPEEWAAFRDHIPADLGHLRVVEAYRDLVFDPDPTVHEPAARAWCAWEDVHVGGGHDVRYDDPLFRLGFARQVTHCWANDSWLADDEIVSNAPRLEGVHGTLIHGRLDASSPLDAPWRLHRAWPGSELVVIDDAGHGGAAMWEVVRARLSGEP